MSSEGDNIEKDIIVGDIPDQDQEDDQRNADIRQLFPPVPPSALQLVETLSSLVPGDVSITGHFASPVP